MLLLLILRRSGLLDLSMSSYSFINLGRVCHSHRIFMRILTLSSWDLEVLFNHPVILVYLVLKLDIVVFRFFPIASAESLGRSLARNLLYLLIAHLHLRRRSLILILMLELLLLLVLKLKLNILGFSVKSLVGKHLLLGKVSLLFSDLLLDFCLLVILQVSLRSLGLKSLMEVLSSLLLRCLNVFLVLLGS